MAPEPTSIRSEYERHPRKVAPVDQPVHAPGTHKRRSSWFQAREA